MTEARVHIPSKHALSTAFRRMLTGWNDKGPDTMGNRCLDAVASRRFTLEDVAAFHDLEPQRENTIEVRLLPARSRTGKALGSIDAVRMCPDSFLPDDGVEERVLVMRREVLEVRRDWIERSVMPAGLCVHQHAIARFYERERLEHDGIVERLRTDMLDLERANAFAIAARLQRTLPGDDMERPHAPGRVGALPFGRGLLMTRSVEVDVRASGLVRTRFTRHGWCSAPGVGHPDFVVPVEARGGPALRFQMTMGITYLPLDMLRDEQRQYRALFQEERALHDPSTIHADIGRLWKPHETPPPLARVHARDELHRLLRCTAGLVAPPPTYLAVGWTPQEVEAARPRPGHRHLLREAG